ncbi:hypothetical protein ScPMuIL_014762 [Solemya velum]
MSVSTEFMQTPLVVWVKTFKAFGSHTLEFHDLCDGVFLIDAMKQIDPRPAYSGLNRKVDDVSVRIHNWEILVRNIQAYYLEVLQQLLVMKLPNIQCICRDPEKESSLGELRKALLLVLGCAVQCDKKERFIEKIKLLDVEVQHAIVEYIKEITDDSESVLAVEPPEQLEAYTEKMFTHLTRLIKERDEYAEVVSDLIQDRDFYQAQANQDNHIPPSPTSAEKHHTIVELADCKAKIRKLRQELEEKHEQISDLHDEVLDHKSTNTKLRNENVDLIQDARAARSLRDEIDILREKLAKATSTEEEVTKYKEKLNELEFYKTRVEELRDDNNILAETKSVLEEQLSVSHKRVETVIELENEVVKYRQQIQDMLVERDSDREKIWALMEENAQLQFEKKSSMNESTNLEQELESARLRLEGIGGSLSDQLTETTNSKLLRLELENQRLHQKLDEMKDKLEKENQRLSKKVEKLIIEIKDQQEKCLDFEQKVSSGVREKDQIQIAFETVKENAERQVRELEKENEHLSQTVESIRHRNEQSNDAKIKDLEKENKRIHQTISQKNQQLSKFEFENRQLQKSYNKLKQNADRISELETECANLEKENNDFKKTRTKLQLQVEKLEEDYLELETDNKKLQKNVDSLKIALNKKDQVELEHVSLSAENQKLQRTLESLKNSSTKIVELENEKDSMNRQIQQLQKSLEAQNTQRVKQEQMELDLLDLDNENQKLQKSLEITTDRLQQLEKDNTELENDNEKLQKMTQTLKVSNIKLNELQKENKELEGEVHNLKRAKSSTDRENKRVKQALLGKESALDDIEARYTVLEREHRNTKKMVDDHKEIVPKLREVERENREILQQAAMEKKTIATLREELVNEKIHGQQLSNDLDKLHQELEKVGINRDHLVMAEQTHDDSRYKALESLMEDALKRSMEIKEEKIQALQSRLEESKSRNIKLQDELRVLKRECESLKQRWEEEDCSRERQETILLRSSAPVVKQANLPAQEIFDLKDHLIEVERMNATLIAENSNLKSHTDTLNEQLKRMENLNSKLQSHTSSLQDQSSSMQSQNAKLQVDQSTLQSQCTSLLTKSSSLQSQLDNLEMEHERVMQSHEGLQSSHEQLVHDHESLQQLHEQLTSEYESLISEHGSLKSLHKSLKNENKDIQDQLDALMEGKNDVNKFKEMLEKEKEQMRMDLKALGNLQLDYNKLRDEHDRLLTSHEKLGQEYRDILGDHKRMKGEFNSIQMKNGELQSDCEEYKDQLHAMDLEITKLANRYEALYQVNQKMEDDNKNLLLQLQSLLNNNQELLTQLLDGKDHFAVEEKSYLEKLSELKRAKERLEEKIMEHYKTKQDTQKKNRGLGAILKRKARILFRAPRSKSKMNLTNLDGSPENMSAESGSFGEAAENDISKRSETRQGRRNSAGNLLETPQLGKQNKSLAKSTMALTAGRHQTEHGHSGFLPGLNPMADDDDDGGFRAMSPTNTRPSRRSSPGSEMLTLEEFLNEAERVSISNKASDSRSQEDMESRSSDNSERSGNQKPFTRKLAPPPPVATASHSVPDVAAGLMSQLDISRLSRISSESNGSGHDAHLSTPVSKNKPDTSTPAGMRLNMRNFEDISQYSPCTKSQREEDNTITYNHRRVSSPPPVSRSLHYSGSQQFSGLGQGHIASPKVGQSRELPITPSDKSVDILKNDQSRDGLPPTERLDRLTMGASPFSPANNSPQSDWLNNSSPNYSNNYSGGGDQSVISAQTWNDRDANTVKNINLSSGGGRVRPQTPLIYGRPPPHSHTKFHQNQTPSPASIVRPIIPLTHKIVTMYDCGIAQ